MAATYTLSLELKRKESQGFLFSVKVKEILGKSLNTFDVLNSLILGFAIGFKGVEAVFNYSDLVANPQEFMLSTRGVLKEVL